MFRHEKNCIMIKDKGNFIKINDRENAFNVPVVPLCPQEVKKKN